MSYKRIAIADRSVLAHKVYETLLKPFGFSLFPFQTLKELKEHLNFKWGIHLLLISSNTFGNYFDQHYAWLEKEEGPRTLPKIFLCEEADKAILQNLKRLPRAQVLYKPFYPPELAQKIERIFRKKR